jgi:hypothetical protein
MGMLTEMTESMSEEQAQQFRQAVQVGSNIVYDKAVFDGLVEGTEMDPVQALALTTFQVINAVEQKVGEMPPASLVALGLYLIYDVADALTQGGMEYTDEQVQEAISASVQMWLGANPGRISQEELQSFMAEGSPGGGIPGVMPGETAGAIPMEGLLTAAPESPMPQDREELKRQMP